MAKTWAEETVVILGTDCVDNPEHGYFHFDGTCGGEQRIFRIGERVAEQLAGAPMQDRDVMKRALLDRHHDLVERPELIIRAGKTFDDEGVILLGLEEIGNMR